MYVLFVCVIYINFIKVTIFKSQYLLCSWIMQNMWYKNHDVIMMLLWWKCALLLVYKYMYFILLKTFIVILIVFASEFL